MPNIDPIMVGVFALCFNIVTQALKGLFTAPIKQAIPLVLLGLGLALGGTVSAYQGGDLVAGALAGFLGAASAVGLYEGAARVPGLRQVFTSAGWLSFRGDL